MVKFWRALKMTNMRTYIIEKLPDSSLEEVSGGLTCKQASTIINIGVYTAVGTGLGAISCTVASAICSSKASRAMQQGDSAKSIYYNNTAKYLSITAGSLGAVAVTAAAMNYAVSTTHGKNCDKCCLAKPPRQI